MGDKDPTQGDSSPEWVLSDEEKGREVKKDIRRTRSINSQKSETYSILILEKVRLYPSNGRTLRFSGGR